MITTNTMSFTTAAKRYFFDSKVKASDVLKELRELTHEDKLEMAPMLAVELGVDEVTISPPKA